MDQESIKALIELVDKSNIGEVKIEQGNFKLTIRHKDYHPKGLIQATASLTPVQTSLPHFTDTPTPIIPKETRPSETEEKPLETKEDTSKYIEIKSPMIGTFYRSSSPESEPFVKIGDVVKKGAVLGIIEAMKLFNEIESELEGTIVKVLVDNATPIEYDQALFLIDPS
ncbi:MAG: acetyl-CoA carboxylase biotin carboxyl carrier protein [Chitinophagales bacterium]|nr:acetyl-CoA carboxylase biotin carboxyl carrier protein [Chitinophagales bacterium]MCZ2392588.1 acetyl-CoA carboxylase biotin carboxyl carrier protein [Chitinophagales bacterium]